MKKTPLVLFASLLPMVSGCSNTRTKAEIAFKDYSYYAFDLVTTEYFTNDDAVTTNGHLHMRSKRGSSFNLEPITIDNVTYNNEQEELLFKVDVCVSSGSFGSVYITNGTDLTPYRAWYKCENKDIAINWEYKDIHANSFQLSDYEYDVELGKTYEALVAECPRCKKVIMLSYEEKKS